MDISVGQTRFFRHDQDLYRTTLNPKKDSAYANALSTFASSFDSSSPLKRLGQEETDSLRGNIQRVRHRTQELSSRHSQSNLVFSLENPWNHMLIQQNHRSQHEESEHGDSNSYQASEYPAAVLRAARLVDEGVRNAHSYNFDHQVTTQPEGSTKEAIKERSRALHLVCNANFDEMSDTELLDLMTGDKSISIVFQKYLYSAWKQGFVTIRSAVLSNMEYLATHPLGNYVLQVLLLRDSQMRLRIEEACCRNFCLWKDNEYASRLMQCLLEVSSSFQYFVSRSFSRSPKGCAKNISCVFLTLALIRNCSNQHWLSFLREYVLAHAKTVLENRHMRRLIASLCEEATHEFLDLFLSKLCSNISLERIVREKSLTSIFQTMIIRANTQALGVFESLLKYRINGLVASGFFKYLLRKCARLRHSDYEFLQFTTRKYLLRTEIAGILEEAKPKAILDVAEWLSLSDLSNLQGNHQQEKTSDPFIQYLCDFVASVDTSAAGFNSPQGPQSVRF